MHYICISQGLKCKTQSTRLNEGMQLNQVSTLQPPCCCRIHPRFRTCTLLRTLQSKALQALQLMPQNDWSRTSKGHNQTDCRQMLALAGACIYKIKPRDTLDSIAAAYGTTTDRLASANNISNRNSITAGTNLQVPCSATGLAPGSQPSATPPSGMQAVAASI